MIVLFVLVVIVLAIVLVVPGNAAPVEEEAPPPPPYDCYILPETHCDRLHTFVDTWNGAFGASGVRIETWRYIRHLVGDQVVEEHADRSFSWTTDEVWIPVIEAGVVVDAKSLPAILYDTSLFPDGSDAILSRWSSFYEDWLAFPLSPPKSPVSVTHVVELGWTKNNSPTEFTTSLIIHEEFVPDGSPRFSMYDSMSIGVALVRDGNSCFRKILT